ncbi:MAG: PHP-associated domain-containing protein [Dehalococcoidia bacterium]
MGKADLHLHTRVSDGLFSVEQLLEYVEHQTDLDVIAVTDHEDEGGGQRARELAAKRGYRFEVVVGAEVTSIHGHVLALFIERAPKSFRSVERTLEEIHAQGGVAVAPHPMTWLTRALSSATLKRLHDRQEAGVVFDGIELCNPSPAGKQAAAKAARLNLQWGLATTGSSDAHHLRCVATGWTEFPGSTAAELRAALVARQTAARMTRYPSLREVGYGRTAAGLVWGYAATPRKVLRLLQRPSRILG